ncbi:MAG: HAMP domain-containing histidine kinase [Bacteroidales bacterium]|nr:HAMP domain-containing histidine kinase [Bacteroidales bacterium]
MSRKVIGFIIIIMSIALIGLISLQTFWIYQEFKLKEEQFNRQITYIFNAINKDLEAKETVVEISNEAFSLKYQVEDLPTPTNILNQTFPNQKNAFTVRKNLFTINDTTNILTNTRIDIFKGDSLLFSKTIVKSKPDNYYQNISDFDINKEIANRLTDKTLFVEKIINKMLNYNDDFSKRVDFYTLYNIIHKQLINHQIFLKFEFAVKNNDGQIVYKTKHFNPDFSDVYKTQLFPNDVFSPSFYLTLYFPEKNNFIVHSLGFMGIVTIALILIIIFSYTITLYIILRQKKLSEMKNDFINNMTHELKTPISTISLAAQMLSDRSICKNGEQMTHVTNIITQETKRLALQVEKVLQMAIFERGEYRFNKKILSLNVLVENICTTFELHVNKRNGKLLVELEAIDDEIEADELHLSNVVINLLENAVKYTEKEPMIVVKTFNLNNSVVVSVKDNGIGISKHDQKHIFEKFYRVHTGNIHNVKGFGLGLSYVKIITDAHNGQVKVFSELGKGSEFQIILPLKSKAYGNNKSTHSFSRG